MEIIELQVEKDLNEMGLRGYIEGYYGRLLTWEERFSLLDKLNDSVQIIKHPFTPHS